MTWQKIIEDKSFQKFLQKRNITTTTTKGYAIAIQQYCEINNFTFHEFIKEQRTEQRSRIQDGIIIEYDPDYGSIDTYQQKFVDTLRERGNRDTSILSKLRRINAVLNALNIKLPSAPQLQNNPKEWYLLSESDIKYLLDISTVKYNALMQFLVSTGFRINDVINLKVKDYIDATKDYHNCTEVKDFLNNATDDMMGYWDFMPLKTRKHKIRVKTFNSPSSNKMILLMLRERQKKLISKGVTLNKEDYLFASSHKQNKGNVINNAYSMNFRRYNQLLHAEKKRVINQKYEEEEISEETYNELMGQFPRVHPHAFRKYYITQVALSCSNPRVISLLEGHSNLLKTDSNYIDVDIDDMYELVKEEYLKVLPRLTFDDVTIDFTLLRKKEALEVENRKLQEENDKIKRNIEDEVTKQIQEVMMSSWLKSQK